MRHAPGDRIGLVLGRLAQWIIVLLGRLVALTIIASLVKPVDLPEARLRL